MTTSITDFTWKPNLEDGRTLLFEAHVGFKGHIRIDTRIFRVVLKPIDGTDDGRRIALDLVGTAPDGAAMSGKLLQNLEEAVCLREVKPAPLIQGHVTISDAPGIQYELIAWLRISKSDSRYINGLISGGIDADS